MGISRTELFARFGVLPKIVDPITELAYEKLEEKIWREDLDSSPHGSPWHTSFHASSFPGDDKMACGRKQIYTLMNIPEAKPISPAGRAIMDAGKDIEERLVSRWAKLGVLLTNDIDSETQTGFVDHDHWLTGNTDAVLLPPGWKRPHAVEIKTKDDSVIDEMQKGIKSFDPEHRRQLLTYIGFVHELQPLLWPDLEPCIDGTIYYVSRSRPRKTMEYYFSYDQGFMEQGRAKLAEWKHAFLEGVLPDRPKDWRWTESPCQWCPMKREVCKKDWKGKVTLLEDSAAIGFAKTVRPDYDYKSTRKAVLDRWS